MTLLEVLVATGLVTIALLSHMASTFAGHRLSRTDQSRSVAVEFMREFVERMRSDEDWLGLYSRLRAKTSRPLLSVGLGKVVELEAYAPTEYYSDLNVPEELETARVVVEVPGDATTEGSVLRESLVAPEFGLPYDLNGDGTIDSEPRTSDYVGLPIIVTMRWTPPGEPQHTMRVPTWLAGER